ncbi:U3 small nucleolar ribonucleoprotein protein, putative [Candida dubliniensis CD36]|uniref:U3 small nucleolar ribonucleoprotein protein MPP10 n=1 Tax=Candida dubliniensis (strain CD36 / ATCC MYA-646 / CBS 7987 / NCPF 3949 / NRRL Y-17841) TaxID=573826 RepID=B9WA65_CANDC|nr:U3 small nucleolar ribonucleoprotein protein, putative [Candida dubliniensis CD36]CAX43284.1 U3 small nucleolar ribonucleoprotein protein, putative [Candida dubliniensis CD36]
MREDTLERIYDRPYEIFSLRKSNGEFFNKLVKSFIDPLAKKYSVLDEIYVDGLDSSQVFGQTKMVLDGVGEELLGVMSEINRVVEKPEEEEGQSEEEEGQSEDLEEEKESEPEEDEPHQQSEEELEEESEEIPEEPESETETLTDPIQKDAFGLNDGFFDIDQFNKQVLAMERDNGDDEIDYFDSLSEDDEEEMDYYNDFYDKPGKFKPAKEEKEFEEEDYDNAVNSAMLDLFAEDEQPAESLSSFEKQQKSIQAEIAKLEAELVADKKWTMKGEITSNERPQESLLEETEIAFDRTAKPVPVITEESTQTLEDLIRKRIKEDEFNDLPRRIITDISKFHKAPKAEVSEQKSSKSLAELYEDEYNNVDAQQESINEEVKKQHDEISELFTKVTHKLDALCSAHFIPKPHQAKTIDIKVSPVVSMEDAQPLHVSSEARLAPQEIYKIGDDKGKEVQLKSGLSYSKDELSRDDKQRLRRAKKRKKAKVFNDAKRQKKDSVVDTLASAKNVTVIGHKGEMRDVRGNLKKDGGVQSSNRFKL